MWHPPRQGVCLTATPGLGAGAHIFQLCLLPGVLSWHPSCIPMQVKPDSSSHAERLRPDFSKLSCRHRYTNTHITALPGVRTTSHGPQSLNPAELGLLVNEVPLPCQHYGVLWAVSFHLRKEKRLKLFDVC